MLKVLRLHKTAYQMFSRSIHPLLPLCQIPILSTIFSFHKQNEIKLDQIHEESRPITSQSLVPLFDQMDERMLDAICERLKPALCTQGTCLVREGDPVNEMLFIIRGNLDSYTTNDGRTGFFNSCRIGPGDFCGKELLTWALDPRPSVVLPSSTRTVKAISEVEAFALIAEDLKSMTHLLLFFGLQALICFSTLILTKRDEI